MSEPNPCNWTPISEQELQALIQSAETCMNEELLSFWHRVRIHPVKWALSPIGDLGGGFWVVAVVGQKCVWFNDIEDGFNTSEFQTPGQIGKYMCNQSYLQHELIWLHRTHKPAESV